MFGRQMFITNQEQDTELNEFIDEISKIDYSIFYRGTVVDNNDPENLGRVRVRVPQIYGAEGDRESDIYVPTYAIPLATPAIMVGAGNNTGAYLIPNIGDTVFVTYENGDSKLPMYFGGILTKGGTNKFIGTDGVNGGELYNASDNDFNTDITNRAQRVIYKSLKGATIIINDNDGNESISIVDQLGQSITLENSGGVGLGRNRKPDNTSILSGRISIKDSYGDVISMQGGEILIKGKKLTVEVDEYSRTGQDGDYSVENDKADEILG